MIRQSFRIFALIAVFGLCNTSFGQQAPNADQNHEVLKKSVGTWHAAAKMWLPGSDSPSESEGTETVTSECSGMWIRTAYSGDFGGIKFQGMGMTTYDPVAKKYSGTWGDNLTPGPARMVGTYDKAKKTMTYLVTGFDPQVEKVVTNKQVERHIDENHREMKIYRGDKVVIHIQYTRTKGSALKKQLMEKVKQLESEAKKIDIDGIKKGVKEKMLKLKGKFNLDSIRKKIN